MARKASNLYSRIGSLERALAESSPSLCADCGGPIPGWSMLILENQKGKHHWGYCGACGLALNERGKALAAYRLKPGEKGWRKVYGPSAIEPIEAIARNIAAARAARRAGAA